MSEHSIKIKYDLLNRAGSVIEVNDLGNIAKEVSRIELDIAANDGPPKVKLDLRVWDIDFESEGVVLMLSDVQHALLVRLGWTPPAELSE